MQSFLHEIEKQITCCKKLYIETESEIFRDRVKRLKMLKNEILAIRSEY